MNELNFLKINGVIHKFTAQPDPNVQKTLGEHNDRISALEAETPYYNLKGRFELGTVYITNDNQVRYENSSNTIRLKNGGVIHLNAGDTITTDATTEFRLVRTDEGYVGMQSYLTTFTVVESGNYTLAMRYKDLSVVDDVEALLARLVVVNGEVKISKHFKKIEEDVDALSAELSSLSADSWRIVTTSDQFEVGTAYQSGSGINYDNSAKDCVRTKRNSTIYIPSGSRIATNGLEVRVVYAESGQVATVANYTADPVDVAVGGAYVLVFRYTDRREITSIDDVLELFTIENGSNPLVERLAKHDAQISTLKDNEVKVDNSAKGVFSIMSYNAGRWYNGSGSKVPDGDFEKFHTLQKGIIDRYSPDILCVQEYSDDISAGKSTLEHLIGSRYYFHPTALGTTSYDGKAICTSRSLSDAANIVFTTPEAALNRNYEKAYVFMNGRKVCIISAHLSQGQTECASNIQQILTDIQDETYVIICADTNIDAGDPTSAKYQATLKQFVDAGYVLANSGDLKTYPKTQTAIDNIIVTSNITIKSTIVDTQKMDELGIDDVDHLPVISYIELF